MTAVANAVAADLYPPEAIARFWSHVDRSDGPDACHPWKRALDRDGYGTFYLGKRISLRAHRVALELHLGRRLEGYEVARHGDHCASKACCNGRHLSAGTQAENIADRDRLGRTAKGERNWRSRLTATQVLEVRSRCASGETKASVARSLGVGRKCVEHIVAGRNWKHLAAANEAMSADSAVSQ